MAINAVELVYNKKSGIFQQTFLGTRAKQPLETHTGPEQPNLFLKAENSKWRHRKL